MKKLFSIFVLLLFAGLQAFGQQNQELPVITVSGSSEVIAAPDEVSFSISVSKTNIDLQVAKQLNDQVVSKVLDLARQFKVEPQNVKTDFISVEMKFESVRDAQKRIYDESGNELSTRVFRGYEVSKTVGIKLTDLSRFEDFFAQILKTEITGINSVTFETSRLREKKDIARSMAMKAAREKAAAMAASIGQSVGKAIKVDENYSDFRSYSNNATSNSTSTSGNFSESETTFAPGGIKVEAKVTVSFLLN
jgi:uncharacterized protein YggE